ncbi:MAG: sugar phosphate isomerase/epimerase [Armatimonadetes bacterium]|nr:sugar phosphate isomerase/epimerase [Armatimonadota bacterium]
MQVGLLTAPYGGEPLETVLGFASEVGFDALEISAGPGSRHVDTANLTKAGAKAIRSAIDAAGLEISSLACYANVTGPTPEAAKASQEALKTVAKAATLLGVEVVCCGAGQPPPGMSREDAIRQIAKPFYSKLCKDGEKAGLKFGLENWYATNIMNLDQFALMFSEVPNANFGLNFDPSHLYWQDICYLAAVEEFAARIFHTHAKDTEVRRHLKARIGNQTMGWWRYVIPGFGDIDWGVYCARLRRVGYNGVLSIEHEDGALGREEGFIKGLAHLRQFA